MQPQQSTAASQFAELTTPNARNDGEHSLHSLKSRAGSLPVTLHAFLAAAGAAVMVASALVIIFSTVGFEPGAPNEFQPPTKVHPIPPAIDTGSLPSHKPADQVDKLVGKIPDGQQNVDEPEKFVPPPQQPSAEPKAQPSRRQQLAIVRVQNWQGIADPAQGLEPDVPAQTLVVALGNRLLRSSPIISPAVPSRFMAVNIGSIESRYQVWNHHAAQPLSQFPIDCAIGDKIALRGDGKYLAVLRTLGNRVEICTVDDRKPREMADLCRGVAASFVDFVGTSLLLFNPHDGLLQFFDVSTHSRIREIQIPSYNSKCFALSPGHRYMAIADIRQAIVYLVDLSRDTPVAIQLELPKELGRGALVACHLRFSMLGNEIAALIRTPSNSRMICWNISTGTEQKHHFLHLANRVQQPGENHTFEWLPDGKGWLLAGGYYVDKEHGGPAASLDQILPKNQTPLRVTSDGRLLIVSTHGNQRTLETIVWPKEEIAKAVERFARGEHPSDVDFPPLTAIDVTRTNHLSSPEVTSTGWQVEPAAVEALPTIEKSTPLNSPRDFLEKLLIAESKARAVLYYDTGKVGAKLPTGTRWAESYNLRSNKLDSKVPIDFASKPVDLSSDGSRLLLQSDAGNRFDVINLDTGKHVVGFRPSAKQVESQPTAVTSAQFVDMNHVVTMSAGGLLVLWKIPECQAVYKFRTNFSSMSRATPVLSPDRKYLALAGDRTIHFVRTMSGESCGRLDTGGATPVHSLAFEPQGSRLAAGFDAGEGSLLRIWSLENAQVAAEVGIPAEPSPLVWCGQGHILCGGRYLADLTQQVVAWKYEVRSGMAFPNNQFGRCWYVTSTAPDERVTLVGLSLPDEQVSSILGSTKVKVPLWPADATYKLSVQVDQCPDTIRNRIGARFTRILAGSKHEFCPDAPFQLKIDAREMPTNRFVEISGVLLGRPEAGIVSVPMKEVLVRLELSNENGEAIWTREEKFATAPPDLDSPLPNGENLQEKLNDQLWMRATGWLDSSALPFVINPKDVLEGYGVSHITPEGPRLEHRSSMPAAAMPTRTDVGGSKQL